MAFPDCLNGEGPIVETVSKIAEALFFSGIEIDWIKDPELRARTKAVLETSHLKVGYGAQPSLLTQNLNLNSLAEDERPWIGFEVKPQRDEEIPEHVIAGTKRVWREAWSRV